MAWVGMSLYAPAHDKVSVQVKQLLSFAGWKETLTSLGVVPMLHKYNRALSAGFDQSGSTSDFTHFCSVAISDAQFTGVLT